METRSSSCFAFFAVFIALLFAAWSAQAATITVNSTADAGGTCPGAACTLRQAIATAAPNDTINFAPGLTTVTLTSGELLINKNLTFNGPGANQLTLQRSAAPGTPNFRIFNILGSVNATISGLTIANGNTPARGGGIYYLQGTLAITNSTISGNTAGTSGGAIFNDGGMLTITNSTISGNMALGGAGGGIYNAGPGTITNTTISGNTASNSGGGIWEENSTLTITNTTISENSAGSGGGIYQAGGTVNVRNTIIARNTALAGPDFFGILTSQGYNLLGNTSGTTITGTATGNQFNVNPVLGPLQNNGGRTFTHALLSGSPAIEGGQSFGSNTDQRGLARPVDSPAFANVGDGSDIGAYEVQADVLPGCSNINRIVNNNADSGTDSLRAVIANVCAGSTITFAPSVTGTINLTSSELLLNKTLTITGPGANLLSVQRDAGAPNFRIFNITPASVIATISGLTIANGVSTGSGGGILNAGTLTLASATISGHRATNGGGIFNFETGIVTIANSTISGNTVSHAIFSGSGGGIFNSGGTLSLTNSTVSGNTAIGPSGNSDSGGGIFTNVGMVTLINSTISGNSADFGGGIRNLNGGVVRSRNTIIALNTSPSGPDVNGPLTSENFNLIGNNSGATITPVQFSDQIGTAGSPINPMFGPLQGNGGPTLTHALLAGSTAIDKGHASGATTDQRGFPRPVGMAAVSDGDGGDIGAFEFSSMATGAIFGDGFEGN